MSKMSPQQRKGYFGITIEQALEHYGNNFQSLKDDCTLALNAEPTKEFVHELFKMMFNNGRSTQELNRFIKDCDYEDDSAEIYFLKIRSHFDVEHGYHIDTPNEIPLSAYEV